MLLAACCWVPAQEPMQKPRTLHELEASAIWQLNVPSANFDASGLLWRQGKLLVFAEVKTRRAGGMGRPLDAVDREKQRLIERGANEWLRQLGTREIPWRFDVIEVILTHGRKPEIRRVENVF